jgi:hypothetical protein
MTSFGMVHDVAESVDDLPRNTQPVYLRHRANILKRLMIHVAGFNLSLVDATNNRKGTPKGLQDLLILHLTAISALKLLLTDMRPSRTSDGGADSATTRLLSIDS